MCVASLGKAYAALVGKPEERDQQGDLKVKRKK
jgi:hypothetical protein